VIEATVVPARPGPVTMHLYASDSTTGLTTTFDATATMSLPSRGITGVKVPLRRTGRAHWSVYGFDIPIRGNWQLEVTVTIGDLTSRTTTFDVSIR
jgi:copper transport protein